MPARAPTPEPEYPTRGSEPESRAAGDVVILTALNPVRYAWLHAVAIVMLVSLSLAGQTSRLVFGHDSLMGLVRDFDLDYERNVPTWFQSGCLLLGAVLAELVARARQSRAPAEARRWKVLVWGLALMSIDEGVSLHERMTVPVEALRNVPEFHPFSWVLPGAALVIAIGAYFWRWLGTLPVRTARLVTLAGVLFVGGSVGMEAAGGIQAVTTGTEDWLYVWTYTIEETFEMAGVLVLNFAMLGYLRDNGVTIAAFDRRLPRTR